MNLYLLIRIKEMKSLRVSDDSPNSRLYNSSVYDEESKGSSMYLKRPSYNPTDVQPTPNYLSVNYYDNNNNHNKDNDFMRVTVSTVDKIDDLSNKSILDNLSRNKNVSSLYQSKSATKYQSSNTDRAAFPLNNIERTVSKNQNQNHHKLGQKKMSLNPNNDNYSHIVEKYDKKERLKKQLQTLCSKKVSDNIRKSYDIDKTRFDDTLPPKSSRYELSIKNEDLSSGSWMRNTLNPGTAKKNLNKSNDYSKYNTDDFTNYLNDAKEVSKSRKIETPELIIPKKNPQEEYKYESSTTEYHHTKPKLMHLNSDLEKFQTRKPSKMDINRTISNLELGNYQSYKTQSTLSSYRQTPETSPYLNQGYDSLKPKKSRNSDQTKDIKHTKELAKEIKVISKEIKDIRTSLEYQTKDPKFMKDIAKEIKEIRTSLEYQSKDPKFMKDMTKEIKEIRTSLGNSSNHSSHSGKKKLSIHDFELKKSLGEGKFGIVYQAIHKETSYLYALKKIKKQMIKSHLMIDQLLQEIKIQAFCHHQNILKIYGVFDDAQYIYLILEYMEDGTLFAVLKKQKTLPEKEAAIKLKQCAAAIIYLQENGIAHRDIKPENIVMSYGVGKLCDFGWATICTDRRKTYCGTFDYVAPEILEGNDYDQTVDLWCLGVLAYQLIVGKAPFYHISRKETQKKIKNVEKLQFPSHISNHAISFIENLIKKNPEDRMGGQDMMKHPFLANAEKNEK